MAGESKVLDLPFFFHLHQVVIDAVLRIQIVVDIHLAYIMEKIEVEILHAGLSELLGEDLLYLRHVPEIVSGELICKIEALTRMGCERLAHDELGVSVMISPCRIKVINSGSKCFIHHFLCAFDIDLRVIPFNDRKTHRAESQRRDLYVLK